MVSVASLWLPVLLSAVLVFVVSSIIHMLLTYHRSDSGPLPDEAGVAAALRPFEIPPGDYVMPHAGGSEDMASPEFAEKAKQGPVAFITPCCPTSRSRSAGAWRCGSATRSWWAPSRAMSPA